MPGAQRAAAAFRDGVQKNLPARLRDRLDEFPWLSVPAK
jgi:hypothetical protein